MGQPLLLGWFSRHSGEAPPFRRDVERVGHPAPFLTDANRASGTQEPQISTGTTRSMVYCQSTKDGESPPKLGAGRWISFIVRGTMSCKRPLIFLVATFTAIFGFLSVAPVFAATKNQVLYRFCHVSGCKDGQKPLAGLVADATGNLYGTTQYGGLGYGTVFQLIRDANGKWIEKVLYNLCSMSACTDGLFPQSKLTFDSVGNLYGAATEGGNYEDCSAGCGTIFQLTPGAEGKWSTRLIYTFKGPDGAFPFSHLIFDAAGNLYGTTWGGGTSTFGTVFRLQPGANGNWTEKVLYNFCSASRCTDGANPAAGLIFDAAGNLYGTTNVGGAWGSGSLFRLAPDANDVWTETVLYDFDGNIGAYPFAELIFDAAGNLYGTANVGGDRSCAGGCGNVFQLVPDGYSKWTVKVVHSFNGIDGAYPYAGVIFDAAGNLYGTTPGGGGGDASCPNGCGVVFELIPDRAGKWTERVLHRFNGSDSAYPYGGVIFDASGDLYGTTGGGATYGGGSAFEIIP